MSSLPPLAGQAPLRVAVLLGGPSPERGISLNSARSLVDHLDGGGVVVDVLVYFDKRRLPYQVSRALLYSNTPDDFDFKLSRTSRPLPEDELRQLLAGCDIAFPVMHGVFGEDGEVQALLEGMGIPYVGSGPDACRRGYDKFLAHETLRDAGLPVTASQLLDLRRPADDLRVEVARVVYEHGAAVLKPTAGGSSLDVAVVSSGDDPAPVLAGLAERHGRVVLQPYVRGTEVTAVVVEGPDGPVTLPPVEIEMRSSTSSHDIFTFRNKYLATDDTHYHCPPRLDDRVVRRVRGHAEAAFRALGMRDFARIDLWVDRDGDVLVSDVNPVSGMEQNSFLFITAAQTGMTHRDMLWLVLSAACRRVGLPPPSVGTRDHHGEGDDEGDGRVPVAVLFGGATAERQVSVLSGTNVWLKLLGSGRFAPTPFLLDRDGSVWEVPYALALRHSMEQIAAACRSAFDDEPRRRRLADEIAGRLGLRPWQRTIAMTQPVHLALDEFLDRHRLVFNALHGGEGEDGTLQALFDERKVAYNGSGPEASSLCMDKYATAVALAPLAGEGVHTPTKSRLPLAAIDGARSVDELWARTVEATGASAVVAKPPADGCSAGVVPLVNASELAVYLDHLTAGAARIGPGRFSRLAPDQIVELPASVPDELLFEEFVETDDLCVIEATADSRDAARLGWAQERDTGWVEVTVGVLGRQGHMRALPPSVTVAREGVLSVEEKFMGGTGVNLTPPPPPPLGRVREEATARTRQLVARVANVLGLRGYARIDAFMHRDTGEIQVIEANTLPALTPATVLYHQALAEDPPMFPRDLLETILDLALA